MRNHFKIKRDSRSILLGILGAVPLFFACVPGVAAAGQDSAPGRAVSGTGVKFSCDYAEYVEKENKLYGKGNVTIEDEGITIRCDEMSLDTEKKEVHAEGNCSIGDEYARIEGESAVYNFDRDEGVINRASCEIEPWHFSGPRIEKKGKTIILHNGYCSSCELARPHYRLTASKMEVVMEDKVKFYMFGLYIGRIPVLVFPYFQMSLKKRGAMPEFPKQRGNLRFGWSNEKGGFVKTWQPYNIAGHIRGMANGEYATKTGLACATKNDYDLPDLKGHLYGAYGYYDNKRQWNIQGEHVQDFAGGLKLQSKIDYMSDTRFNKIYNKEENRDLPKDWELMTQDMTSHIALSYAKSGYSVSMYGNRKDKWDDTLGRFYQTKFDAPVMNFAANSREVLRVLNVPINGGFGFNAGNYFVYGSTGYYKKEGSANVQTSTNFRINRATSLSLAGTTQGSWKDRQSRENTEDLLSGALSTTMNLRTDMMRMLTLDLSHSYRYDIKEKETTSSSMALKARVSQRETSIEASTAYDMLGPEENKFLDNFSDINAILNYKFPFWSFYLGSRTDVSPLKLKSINTDFNYSPFKGDWQNPEVRGWYFRDRVVYAGRENQDPSELKMDVTNTLGCWIGRGIRVNFTLRMDFFPFAYSRFTERLLTLYKDLHCWEMSFTWDKRLKEEQFWVKFTLKAVPEARLGGYHNVEKDEWRLLTE